MQYSLQQMQSDIVETPQKSYYKSPSCAFRKRVLSSWILVLEVSPFVMSQKVLRAGGFDPLPNMWKVHKVSVSAEI